MEHPLSKLTTTVFLLCLATTIPLGIAEYCSGGDAPYEMMVRFATLLGWTVFTCIVVPLVGDVAGKWQRAS